MSSTLIVNIRYETSIKEAKIKKLSLLKYFKNTFISY